MTSDLFQTAQPVAISFKEFRNEEIVDFFANENRTFQSAANHGAGRNRLVGSPHFTLERKGTAAFRSSFKPNGLQSEHPASRCDILREESVTSIPIPPDIFVIDPEVIAATIIEVPKKKRKTIEPTFGKPARSLASVLMTERKNISLKEKQQEKQQAAIKKPCPAIKNVEKRIRETDEQLNRLIETWPRLSTELKETISALLEGSEKADLP